MSLLFIWNPIIPELIQRGFMLFSPDSSLELLFSILDFGLRLYPIASLNLKTVILLSKPVPYEFSKSIFFLFSIDQEKRDKFPCHLSCWLVNFSTVSICSYWAFLSFIWWCVWWWLGVGVFLLLSQVQELISNSTWPLKSKPLHYKD